MKNKGIFITGTDTGIGKTITTAVIARLLQERGFKVGVMKPVTSGCTIVDGKLVSEDAEILKWASMATAPAPDITPYLLHEPLAPSVAAAIDGVSLSCETIRNAYERLAAAHDIVVVEGAGGLMVPLTDDLLFVDLIRYLALPALVVARPNLGTINHTLMTCYCARQMGIEVKGIIINRYPQEPGLAEQYAPEMLTRRSGVPVLGVLPEREERDATTLVESICDHVRKTPLASVLLDGIEASIRTVTERAE